MTTYTPKDIDLNQVLSTVRRAALPILGAAVLLALIAYLYASTRPSVYQATASISVLSGGSNNSVINNTLVTAPILPPAVISRALRSPEVIAQASRLIAGANPNAPRKILTTKLQRELQTGDFNVISLAADVNQDFVGAYEISARASSPQLAQLTANSFVSAMLTWDRNRALENIVRARKNLMLQRQTLSQPNTDTGLNERTLTAMRVDIAQQLQQIDVLTQTLSGTLSSLASASLPAQNIEPKPLRNAALVFATSLFFGLLAAFALEALRRRLQPEDLQQYSAPVLGILPPLLQRFKDAKQLIRQAERGILREQLDFVRVGLKSILGTTLTHPVLAISSALIGEGKSTLVAALAANLAHHGQRVLVVDADIFRFQQLNLWFPAHTERTAPNMQMANGIQLWFQIIPGVDIAAPSSTAIEVGSFTSAIREISRGYDIVLVDTGPVLKVADTLVIAAQFDGLLLVVDANTARSQLEQALRQIGRLQVPLLGFVLNRFREATAQSAYTYAYESTPPSPVDVP